MNLFRRILAVIALLAGAVAAYLLLSTLWAHWQARPVQPAIQAAPPAGQPDLSDAALPAAVMATQAASELDAVRAQLETLGAAVQSVVATPEAVVTLWAAPGVEVPERWLTQPPTPANVTPFAPGQAPPTPANVTPFPGQGG